MWRWTHTRTFRVTWTRLQSRPPITWRTFPALKQDLEILIHVFNFCWIDHCNSVFTDLLKRSINHWTAKHQNTLTRTKLGETAFSFCAPLIWNKHPENYKTVKTLSSPAVQSCRWLAVPVSGTWANIFHISFHVFAWWFGWWDWTKCHIYCLFRNRSLLYVFNAVKRFYRNMLCK